MVYLTFDSNFIPEMIHKHSRQIQNVYKYCAYSFDIVKLLIAKCSTDPKAAEQEKDRVTDNIGWSGAEWSNDYNR